MPGLDEAGPDDLGEDRVHRDVGRGQLLQCHPAIMAFPAHQVGNQCGSLQAGGEGGGTSAFWDASQSA